MGASPKRRTGWGAFLIGLAASAIFWASPVLQIVDSNYGMLLSEHLLLHRSFELDRYFWPEVDSRGYPEVLPGKTLPRHVQPVREHLYYIYPPGTSVLSIPLVAGMRALGVSTVDREGKFDAGAEARIQRVVAALVSGAACAVFFLIARRLLPSATSVCIALAGGLSTQVWSTASRGTWSHTWMVCLVALALLVLLRAETGGRFRPILFANLMAASFFVRPLAALYVLPLTAWAVARHRQRALPTLAVGALWIGLFLVYNLALFGEPWSEYYGRGRNLQLSSFWDGLHAGLWSPSRGLFVYAPLCGLVAWQLLANRDRLEHRGLAAAALVGACLHLLVVSLFRSWWAGVSYGARYTTELVPVLVLLGAIGARASLDAHGLRPRLERGAFWLLFAVGTLVNGAGAVSPAGLAWNTRPTTLRAEPERVFDWSRAQFLVALFPSRLEPARATGPGDDELRERARERERELRSGR